MAVWLSCRTYGSFVDTKLREAAESLCSPEPRPAGRPCGLCLANGDGGALPANLRAAQSCSCAAHAPRSHQAFRRLNLCSVLVGILLHGVWLRAAETLQGNVSVHDPSTIVKCKGEYWLFATGPGIASRHSKDLVTWEAGPRVFTNPPAWTTNAVRGNRGYFWAPDVIRIKDQFYLFYSVSTWGSKTSVIGLATNPTLDPSDANYLWTDRGTVIRSGAEDNFNCIDPCVMQDATGHLWLGFGSFWSGIRLVQLNPATGLRTAPDSPIHSLAYHPSIEAACIAQHGGWFYLFVNWGQCCRGVNSTYNIRVGRSAAITGPYLDKDGVDLLRDGGSLLLGTTNAFIGPGHAGVFSEGGANWLTCHFYDGNNRGRAALAIRPLNWSADGWPVVAPPESRGAERPVERRP